jgi:tetratricopeptide (TPR) repeat protein
MCACCLLLLAWLPFLRASQNETDLQAIESARHVLQERPDSESSTFSLASLYLKVGRNQDAIQLLQSYLQSQPMSAKALRLLATAYLRKEDYAAAKETAEKALKAGTRDSTAVELLAMSELGLQESDAAERHFLEALKLNSKSIEANYQLGLLYTKQHKALNEAVRLLQTARRIQPDLTGIDTALGAALLGAGNVSQAVDALEIATKTAANKPESYYLLATAYRRLNQPEKADAALASFNALKKADADRRAREMRGKADYEEGVNLLSNSDQLELAYTALSKALEELPDFDAAYYRIAQVSYLKGDLPEALTSIRRAIKLNPFEPEYYFVLARCLQDNDSKAALEAIDNAINLRPGVQDFEDLSRELKSKLTAKPPA